VAEFRREFLPVSPYVEVTYNHAQSFSVHFTANKIIYGQETRLTISFTQSYRGRYHDRAEILFEDTQLGKEFVIVRPLRVIVGSREDYAALRPTAPYVPRRRTNRPPATEVVPGVVGPFRPQTKFYSNMARRPPSPTQQLNGGFPYRRLRFPRMSTSR